MDTIEKTTEKPIIKLEQTYHHFRSHHNHINQLLKDSHFRQTKKIGQIRIKISNRRTRSQINSGQWTLDQNLRYSKFLKTNIKTYFNVKKRKRSKFFVRMAKAVITRSPNQCRSHHQKWDQKFQHVSEIINFIEGKTSISFNLSQNTEKVKIQTKQQYVPCVEIEMEQPYLPVKVQQTTQTRNTFEVTPQTLLPLIKTEAEIEN